jgi:hypothetical protein
LKILEKAAGIQVAAQPGDLLLNKDSGSQGYGVGFETLVFASPGQTTVAQGVSVFCINHSLVIPNSTSFDVLGPAAELPGYEDLGKLLQLSGSIQTSLDETPTGMQDAIWNVTDATPFTVTLDPDAARARLSQAGVTEDSHPGGLPYIPNPNAGSAETAAVSQTGVLETMEAEETKRQPAATIEYAQLYPNRLSAGKQVRADLFLSMLGGGERLSVTIQRRKGRHWRRVRSLPARKIDPGTSVLPLKLGLLTPGRYRLALAVSVLGHTEGKRQVSFAVR